MQCPNCKGKGFELMTGFIDYSDGTGEWVNNKPMSCYQCNSTGEVPEAQAKQMRIGQFIRRTRIDVLKITQREAAKVIGMSFQDYNDLEHGRYGFGSVDSF